MNIEDEIDRLLNSLAFAKGHERYASARCIENTLWIALQLNEPLSSDKYMNKIQPNYFPCEKQLQKIIAKQSK